MGCGHLVTQFQGQILRAAANNRVRGHASVCGYAPPFPYIKGDLAMCGVYRRRYFLLRSVTRLEPSTHTTYWSNCRTSTTIPLRSHLVGWGPTRFCSLTQFPMTSGGRTRVCSDSRSCALMCRTRSASSLAFSVSRQVQCGRYSPGGAGMKSSRMRRPN